MSKLLLALLSLLIIVVVACEKKEERILPKVDTVAQPATGEKPGLERDAFIRQAQKELDELGVELNELRQKAVNASGSARQEMQRKIAALEQEQKEVAEKLAAMQAVIGEKWKEMRSDFTRTFEKFKQSVKNAI